MVVADYGSNPLFAMCRKWALNPAIRSQVGYPSPPPPVPVLLLLSISPDFRRTGHSDQLKDATFSNHLFLSAI